MFSPHPPPFSLSSLFDLSWFPSTWPWDQSLPSLANFESVCCLLFLTSTLFWLFPFCFLASASTLTALPALHSPKEVTVLDPLTHSLCLHTFLFCFSLHLHQLFIHIPAEVTDLLSLCQSYTASSLPIYYISHVSPLLPRAAVTFCHTLDCQAVQRSFFSPLASEGRCKSYEVKLWL